MQYLKQKKKELSFIFICFLVMGLACLLLYQPLMDILKDPQVLRTQLQSYGIGGQLLLIGIMTLQVVFVFLPGEIIEIMAGFIYGPIVGMIICMIGSAVGSSIIYLFVKKCGIRFIDKLIGLDKVNEVEFLKNKEKRYIMFHYFLYTWYTKRYNDLFHTAHRYEIIYIFIYYNHSKNSIHYYKYNWRSCYWCRKLYIFYYSLCNHSNSFINWNLYL